MLDLFELINENFFSNASFITETKLENICIYYISSFLSYKNTGYIIYKDTVDKLYLELLKFYNDELGIIVKNNERDPFKFSPTEICLYIMCLFLNTNECEDNSSPIISSIFKKQLVNSGIILSWPETPSLDDRERYKIFSLNSDDLLEEQDFRMSSIPTPENINLASIFIKNITFSERKHEFKQGKTSFYSNKNMLIFFFTIYLCNNCYL